MKTIDSWKTDEDTTQSLRSLFRERNIDYDPHVYLAEIHRWALERDKPDPHAHWTLEDLLQFERLYERDCFLRHPGCGDSSCPECKGHGFVDHNESVLCDVSRRCSTCMPTLGLMFMPRRKPRRIK